jgi:hypothetical protein
MPGQVPQIFAHLIDIRTSPPRGFNIFIGETVEPIHIKKGKNSYWCTGVLVHRQMMILNGQTVSFNGDLSEDRPNLLRFLDGNNIKDRTTVDFLANFKVFRNFAILNGQWGNGFLENRLLDAYFND